MEDGQGKSQAKVATDVVKDRALPSVVGLGKLGLTSHFDTQHAENPTLIYN